MTRARDTADTQDNVGGSVPPFAAGKNKIINGGFDIWQRGTSFTPSASSGTDYTTDRWVIYRSSGAGAVTVSRQSSGLTGFNYSCRVQRNSGNTSTAQISFSTTLENDDSLPYAGRTVVLSFYAKAGANYSASSGTLTPTIYTGTGSNQQLQTGLTGLATVATTSSTLTTSWQRFTLVGTVGSSATQLAVNFQFIPVGTASTNDWFEITGVQLEAGSVATPFNRNAGTIQGELAACQRYYIRINDTTNSLLGNGTATSTTATALIVNLPVSMRVRPTSIEYSSLQVSDGVTNTAVSSVSSGIGNQSVQYINAGVASGLTQYRPYYLQQNGSTGYLGFSAEL